MASYEESLAVCKAKTKDAQSEIKGIVLKHIISDVTKIPTAFIPNTKNLKNIFNHNNAELVKNLIVETAKNTNLNQIEDVYSHLKLLLEAKDMADTAGMISRARKLKSVIKHLDGAFKDFFFSVGLDDAFFAAMDTDLGHWVVNNAGQAQKDLSLIISHVKAGDFWHTLIEEGKTTDWEQIQREHNQFGKELVTMFGTSLVQGSYNMAEGMTERIRGVADFLVDKIVIPTLNGFSTK
jgi:hypothetical protein